jgi:hypothetical protein
MELSFANGVQEYTVHGVKGDVIIRFNPTDGAFIQRLYNAFDTLDKKQSAMGLSRDKITVRVYKGYIGKGHKEPDPLRAG